jgi:hypothetical protein
MSSLSYLGSKLVSIYTVFVGPPSSICMALASSGALKALGIKSIAGLSSVEGTRRLSSLVRRH